MISVSRNALVLIGRTEARQLGQLVSVASRRLAIASPFITQEGAEFVAGHAHPNFRSNGQLTVLTNLSAKNVCEGATEPRAVQRLASLAPSTVVWHVPGLHAKIYLANAESAIITSANLTRGGLYGNLEYGLTIRDAELAARIQQDLLDFAALGAEIPPNRLDKYCEAADHLRAAFSRQRAAFARTARAEFERQLHYAQDELIRLRLAGGAMHTVFSRTILYLLRLHGPLATRTLHPRIAALHPDLCDDSVDRIIDGQRFGKKWKHAVRTAQQHLKERGAIQYRAGLWHLANDAPAAEG
jgi:hypothetical protein